MLQRYHFAIFFTLFILPLFTVDLRADESGIVSRRIGNEIDVAEREYFGLFPEIVDFQSATVTSTDDGGAVLRIARGSVEDTTITINKTSLTELRTYIEDYEALFREQRQLDWKLLEGLVGPSLVLPHFPNIIVQDRSGHEVAGQLLAISDSGLVVWNDPGPYDWRHVDEQVVVFPVHRIEYIEYADRLKNKWYWMAGGALGGGLAGLYTANKANTTFPGIIFPAFWVGFAGEGIGEQTGIDMPIGGNPELYRPVAQSLAEHIEITTPLPPELVRTIDRQIASAHDDTAPVSVEEIMDRYPHTHIHFGVEELLSSVPATNSSLTIDLSMFGAKSEMSTTRISNVPWAFSVEYSLFTRLRLGARLYLNRPSTETSYHPPQDYVKINTAGATIGYEIITLDPLMRSHFELLASAGVTHNDWSVWGTQSSTKSTQPFDTLYKPTGTMTGALGAVQLSYYATRNYSMYFGLEGQWMPKFTVGRHEELILLKDYVREHEIDLSRIGVAFGLQVHL